MEITKMIEIRSNTIHIHYPQSIPVFCTSFNNELLTPSYKIEFIYLRCLPCSYWDWDRISIGFSLIYLYFRYNISTDDYDPYNIDSSSK